jgi:hypothetical protein
MNILRVLIGLLVLLLGRRLFWFFVGAVGFIAGVRLAPQLFPNQPDWAIIGIALLAGVIGAVIAIFAQGVAIVLAGFFAGAYLATVAVSLIGLDTGSYGWLPYIVGGIIGAILLLLVFDWALIILSSLVGATMVVQGLQVTAAAATLIFLVLLVIGIIFQAGLSRRRARAL